MRQLHETSTVCIALLALVCGIQGCHNDGSLKNVGEKCKADSECYSAGNTDAISCKSGLCTCNEGYVAQMQWFTPTVRQLVCQPAPYQDQACTSICQKPFTCADSSIPDMKTCQCRPPAQMKDGVCSPECKPDEFLEGGECRRRCEADEIREGYVCKKIGKLGAKCETKNQCSAPFSQCVDGVCSCVNGFTPNSKKDACESTHRWCPVGSPIRANNKIVECKISRRASIAGLSDALLPFPRPGLLEDNCGPDQFCFVTSGEVYFADGAIGHCCLMPKLQCPYGFPHPNATCGVPVPNKGGKAQPTLYCPYGTHSCIRFPIGAGFDRALCCPIACGSNQIYSDGVCYPKRDWGGHCQINDQCKGHVGVCEKGKCTCGKDYETEGGITYRFCRRVCKDNEVLVDSNRCLPKLKMGAKCDPEVSAQCPINAYCSAEKRECDCFCGYLQLDEDSCGPQPMCPDVKASTIPFSLDSLGNVSAITLCRIPGRPKPSLPSAVETCPNGQYCSAYFSDYGLCCPKPEKPFCPNGASPGKKCDPKEANPCGPLSYCNRYLSPAGDDGSLEGYVCCSVLPIFIQPINLTDPLIDPSLPIP